MRIESVLLRPFGSNENCFSNFIGIEIFCSLEKRFRRLGHVARRLEWPFHVLRISCIFSSIVFCSTQLWTSPLTALGKSSSQHVDGFDLNTVHHISSKEKKSWLRFKPGAAGWEARMLPLFLRSPLHRFLQQLL